MLTLQPFHAKLGQVRRRLLAPGRLGDDPRDRVGDDGRAEGALVQVLVRGAEVVDRLASGHDQPGVLHAGVRVHGQDVRQGLVADGDVAEAVRVDVFWISPSTARGDGLPDLDLLEISSGSSTIALYSESMYRVRSPVLRRPSGCR
jgi:hypothetical protein